MAQKMRMALKFENADESKVYVISHVPDQLEDTYFLLYNMDYIVIVDIPKFDDGEIIVKNVPIGEYKKNLTKRNRRKLQVAIRMISAQK